MRAKSCSCNLRDRCQAAQGDADFFENVLDIDIQRAIVLLLPYKLSYDSVLIEFNINTKLVIKIKIKVQVKVKVRVRARAKVRVRVRVRVEVTWLFYRKNTKACTRIQIPYPQRAIV